MLWFPIWNNHARKCGRIYHFALWLGSKEGAAWSRTQSGGSLDLIPSTSPGTLSLVRHEFFTAVVHRSLKKLPVILASSLQKLMKSWKSRSFEKKIIIGTSLDFWVNVSSPPTHIPFAWCILNLELKSGPAQALPKCFSARLCSAQPRRGLSGRSPCPGRTAATNLSQLNLPLQLVMSYTCCLKTHDVDEGENALFVDNGQEPLL